MTGMSTLSLGLALLGLGLALTLGAWTFFRKEEYDFFTFAPFTDAHRYMRQPGGIMWWIGIAAICVGVFECWAAR